MNQDHENAGRTQQQLKNIYAGKSASWKAVGGADRPIIAFHRNADSGSHTRRENAWGAYKSAVPRKSRGTADLYLFFDPIEGTLFQAADLGLADADFAGYLDLGHALEKAEIEDALLTVCLL